MRDNLKPIFGLILLAIPFLYWLWPFLGILVIPVIIIGVPALIGWAINRKGEVWHEDGHGPIGTNFLIGFMAIVLALIVLSLLS